jgi:hypothetical protein
MQVTANVEYHVPSHGRILAHHPKRGALQRRIMKTVAARKGDERYYVFQAYPRRVSLDQCLDALDARWHVKLDRLMLRDIVE